MDNSFSTPIKDSQSQTKSNKAHNETRDGDWVCLNCSNLNFSFRKKCNRCKTQTRKQNQELQNAYNYYYYTHQAQQQESPYIYQNGMIYQPVPDQLSDISDHKNYDKIDQGLSPVQGIEKSSSLSMNKNHNHQFIQMTITSPFKELINNLSAQEKTNKKLRTPSSKKKRTHQKKNDMLPSVSPLLKKLLAKQDSHFKSNISNIKDPLNVALFYDEMWDSNKQNHQNHSQNLLGKEEKPFLTNSGKKVMGNSRMNKTNDSFNVFDEDYFAYVMKSPQKCEDDDIIEIDQGDQQLAQIISRIMI